MVILNPALSKAWTGGQMEMEKNMRGHSKSHKNMHWRVDKNMGGGSMNFSILQKRVKKGTTNFHSSQHCQTSQIKVQCSKYMLDIHWHYTLGYTDDTLAQSSMYWLHWTWMWDVTNNTLVKKNSLLELHPI